MGEECAGVCVQYVGFGMQLRGPLSWVPRQNGGRAFLVGMRTACVFKGARGSQFTCLTALLFCLVRSPAHTHSHSHTHSQVMNEGPGHVQLNKIPENMEKQLDWCR